jgi:hypothetical protein
MSHGNITITVGQCPVCGGTDVELHRYRDVYGVTRLACTDEFDCLARFAADRWQRWNARRRAPRGEQT